MDEVVSDDAVYEPTTTVTTPGSDVAFLSGSSSLDSFKHRGSEYYHWLATRWRSDCLGQLYHRLFPLGYKKECKSLVLIAWAIILTSFLQQMFFVVTTMFVGHLGKLQLDAAALGITMVNVLGCSVLSGLSTACDTLFPQIYGSSNRRNLGVVIQKSVIILLLLCVPCWGGFINISHFLLATGQDPVVANMAGQFAICYIPTLPANVVYFVLSKYLQAQSIVLPSCIILLVGNFLNATLLAIFLHSFHLDIIGAGLSLCLSWWAVVVMHIVYIKLTKVYKETWTGWSVQSLFDWKSFFSLALPGLFMVCLEWWCFEIFVILAGLLGGVELAAHAILFQIVGAIFMISLGMAVAVGVRVGNHLGEGNPDAALNSSHVAISLTWIIAMVIGVLLLLFKSTLPMAFTTDVSVISLVSALMPLVAFAFLLDSTQCVCSGILRASGKQMFGASLNFISYYVVALPVGALLMFRTYLQLGGLWMGIIVAVGFQSIAFMIKIQFSDWVKEAKDAQERSGRVVRDEEEGTDRDISPLQSPSSDDNLEADHIQLSTYSSLESVRSSQSDELTELQKTLLKRGVFVVCLLMVLGMGVIVNRVLVHLNSHSNCFLIHGKDLNLTLLYNDLHNNDTLRNLTLNELQFLNLTYWFEKEHQANASFTYCDGLISDKPVSSASMFNMSSFLYSFHHKIPHRPIF